MNTFETLDNLFNIESTGIESEEINFKCWTPHEAGSLPWNYGRPCDYKEAISRGVKKYYETHSRTEKSRRQTVETKRKNGVSFATTSRQVICKNTGKVYPSIKAAADDLPIGLRSIRRQLDGIYSETKGIKVRYYYK